MCAQIIAGAKETDRIILINALSCKGNCQFRMNLRAEESKTWEQVLALQKLQFGEMHFAVFVTEVSLAWALWASGEKDRAVERLKATVPVAAKVLGDENQITQSAKTALQIILEKPSPTAT